MVTERGDADEWPTEVDPLAGAILPMIEAIYAQTHDNSPERACAMRKLMLSVERISRAS
jgi:hypothetical protein